MLDITASSESREITYKTVESIAGQVFIPLTVGGGVRNTEDIKRLLRSGADKVSINTAAVENPDFIKEASDKFGSQCIVVAVDAKATDNASSSWEVVTYGGRKRTGMDVIDWVNKVKENGAGEILLTSMDADGTQKGIDDEITSMISELVDVPIIASGGIGKLIHFKDAIINGKADAVLAASVFHRDIFSIHEICLLYTSPSPRDS